MSNKNRRNLPTITVVIANHNYGQYIVDAIQSVLNNDYPQDKINICVFHDKCTDNSKEVTDKFGKRLLGVVENNNENAFGPSAARNSLIKAAWDFTDIYAILDADDIYHENKISESVEVFLKDENVGVVYADYNIIDTRTGTKKVEFKEPYNYNRLLRECIVHSNSLISKKAFEAAGFYDESFLVCEDWHLWLRIAKNHIIHHIPKPLMDVRTTGLNSSFTRSNEVWQQHWKKIQEFVRNNG